MPTDMDRLWLGIICTAWLLFWIGGSMAYDRWMAQRRDRQ